MNKILLSVAITLTILGSVYFLVNQKVETVNFSGSSYRDEPTFYSASTTVFTLTTTSQRLLGTSTPTRRIAATIQPTNCTVTQATYVRMDSDKPATAITGMAVVASTTLSLGGYQNIPIVQGSVTGITAVGTCTVIVTEWRTQY